MINLKNRKEKSKILLFLSPAFLVYTIFMIIPLLGAVYFAFSRWNGISGNPIEYVGLKNFISVFNSDAFVLSLKNMGKMVFLSVLFHTPIALLAAVALNAKYSGYRFFKALFFIPTVFPLTVTGLLWYFIFMPSGSLNSVLNNLGLSSIVRYWLIEPKIAMYTVIFVNIWAGIGYYMIILLAGLTTISEDMYEAAAIDGATSFQNFFYITIPLLKPIISMCIIMDIIGTVKVFDLVFVMTGGGPNGLTNLPTTLMYNEAFRYDNYGLGSAIGIVILAIALVLTVSSRYFMSKRNKRGRLQ